MTMKKLFVVLLIGAGSSALHAQTKLGVQAGSSLSIASFSKDAVTDIRTNPVYGSTAGIFADFSLSKNWSIRPAIQYMLKGVKVKAESMDGNMPMLVKSDMKLHYFELPVLMTCRYRTGSVNLMAGIGPSAGLGFKGKNYTEVFIDNSPDHDFDFEIDPFKESEYSDEPFKRFEFSGAAFAGVELDNGLFVSANYLHGFSNIEGNVSDKYHNRTVSVTLGYTIQLKKKN